MPRLIPTISVGVSRKVGTRSQTIYPTVGEMFDFTDEEIEQIRAEHPEGLRKPINETVDKPPAKASKSKEVTSTDEEMTVKETESEDVPQPGSTRRPTGSRRPGVRHVSGDDDEEL